MPASHFAKKYGVSMEKAKKINAAYMANKNKGNGVIDTDAFLKSRSDIGGSVALSKRLKRLANRQGDIARGLIGGVKTPSQAKSYALLGRRYRRLRELVEMHPSVRRRLTRGLKKRKRGGGFYNRAGMKGPVI